MKLIFGFLAILASAVDIGEPPAPERTPPCSVVTQLGLGDVCMIGKVAYVMVEVYP